jgi:hypothetical protein
MKYLCMRCREPCLDVGYSFCFNPGYYDNDGEHTILGVFCEKCGHILKAQAEVEKRCKNLR